MFIAYAICVDDQHLVYRDGLGFVTSGSTRELALESLKRQFMDNFATAKDGDDPTGEKYWNECLEDGYYRFFTVPTTGTDNDSDFTENHNTGEGGGTDY